MKTVLFSAPSLSISGYGVHSRQVARYLLSKEPNIKNFFEIVPWGDTSWHLDKTRLNGLIGNIMFRTGKVNFQPDVSIQLKLPNEWNPHLAKYNIGMSAVVETDRCNPAWVDACNRMNMVIVPSTHTKTVLETSGRLHVPVHVVPESFPDAVFSDAKLNMDFETAFNFLVFGQITGNDPETDRKNIFYTVKWLCEEFANDKDVGVVLKTNASKNTKIDRRYVVDIFSRVLKDIRKTQFPKFYLLHGDMTDEEIVGLYRHQKVKALVIATRGEGFCIPALEAAACGLPVIASNWSGHLDFLNKGKFIKLDYTLKNVPDRRIDNQIFVPGVKWAEVDEQDFKRKVRKFYSSSSIPKEWAKELAEVLKKDYSFTSIANEYDKLLGKILMV